MEREQFAAGLSAALTVDLAERDAAALRRAVARSAAAAESFCGDRPMACGPGCPDCCVLNVAVLLPEAMTIADWLVQTRSPASLARLQRRLARHSCSVRWLDDEARIFQRASCPFLDETGSCAIHPVRPLVCRGAASFDRNSCRQAFNPIAEPEREVAVDLLRQSIFDLAFVTLAETLRQQGFDDRSIELGTGVLAFLEGADCRPLLLAGAPLPHALWE